MANQPSTCKLRRLIKRNAFLGTWRNHDHISHLGNAKCYPSGEEHISDPVSKELADNLPWHSVNNYQVLLYCLPYCLNIVTLSNMEIRHIVITDYSIPIWEYILHTYVYVNTHTLQGMGWNGRFFRDCVGKPQTYILSMLCHSDKTCFVACLVDGWSVVSLLNDLGGWEMCAVAWGWWSFMMPLSHWQFSGEWTWSAWIGCTWGSNTPWDARMPVHHIALCTHIRIYGKFNMVNPPTDFWEVTGTERMCKTSHRQ